MTTKHMRPAPCRARGAGSRSANESTQEIIGILTAISVVSKRMAKKLALLDQQAAGKGGNRQNGKNAVPRHAD